MKKITKKGIFKNLEITGKDLTIDEIPVPYLKIKTETDYISGTAATKTFFLEALRDQRTTLVEVIATLNFLT